VLLSDVPGSQRASRGWALDKAGEDFFRAQGYRVIRFTNGEVYEQADSVLDAILDALAEGGA